MKAALRVSIFACDLRCGSRVGVENSKSEPRLSGVFSSQVNQKKNLGMVKRMKRWPSKRDRTQHKSGPGVGGCRRGLNEKKNSPLIFAAATF